ncbi:MAG: hypothetical protein AB8C84_07410 [Oligoflexales bacterium]
MVRVVNKFSFFLLMSVVSCSQKPSFEGGRISQQNFADAEAGQALTCITPSTTIYAGENHKLTWAPRLQGLGVSYLLSTSPSSQERGTVTDLGDMSALYAPPANVTEAIQVKITAFPADESILPGVCEFEVLPARTPVTCETSDQSLIYGGETLLRFSPESIGIPAYRAISGGEPIEGIELIGDGQSVRVIHNADLQEDQVVQIIASLNSTEYTDGICDLTLVAPEPPTQIVCESDPVTLRDGDSTLLRFGPSDLSTEVGYQILRDGVVVNDEFSLVADGLEVTLTMPEKLSLESDLEIKALPLGVNARKYLAGSCAVTAKPLSPPVALSCDSNPVRLLPGEEATLVFGPEELSGNLVFESRINNIQTDLLSVVKNGQSAIVKHTGGVLEEQRVEVFAQVVNSQDGERYIPAVCEVTLLPPVPPTPVFCATPDVKRLKTGDTVILGFTPEEPGLEFSFEAFQGENPYPNFDFAASGSEVEVTFTGSVSVPADIRIVATPLKDNYLRAECITRVIPNPVALECAQTPDALKSRESGDVLFTSKDGQPHRELQLGYRLSSNLDQAGSFVSLDDQHGVLYSAPDVIVEESMVRIETFSLSEDYPIVPGVCEFPLTPDPIALSCDTLPQSIQSGESVDLQWSAQGQDIALNFEVEELAQEDGRVGTFAADRMSGVYTAPDFIRESRRVKVIASSDEIIDGREITSAVCEVRLVEEDPVALSCEGDGVELLANESVEFQIQPESFNFELQSSLLQGEGTVVDLEQMKVRYTAPANIAQDSDVIVQVDGGLQTLPARCQIRLKSNDRKPPVCKHEPRSWTLDYKTKNIHIEFDHVQHGVGTEYWVEVEGAAASAVNLQSLKWKGVNVASYTPPTNWKGHDFKVKLHLKHKGDAEHGTCELIFKKSHAPSKGGSWSPGY